MALAIAVLALAALFGLVRGALIGTARSETIAEATLLAESTLEAMGTVAPLVDGDTADQQNGRFHVHATVQRYPDVAANGYVVPYALATTVSWRDGGQTRSVSLSTLRLGAPP